MLPFLKKQKKEKIEEKNTAASEPWFLIVHKKGQRQSNIRVGSSSITRQSKDILAVKIANLILGGSSLNSRLGSEIRVKRGLTYSIYSHLIPLLHEGILLTSTSTRLEVTKQSADRILDTMEIFYKKGSQKEEVETAKKQYKINVLSQMNTPADRLLRRMILKFYGLPYDLPSLNRRLNRLKINDINKVIKKYFNPSQTSFVIFTDFDQVKSQFEGIENLEVKNFEEFL